MNQLVGGKGMRETVKTVALSLCIGFAGGAAWSGHVAPVPVLTVSAQQVATAAASPTPAAAPGK